MRLRLLTVVEQKRESRQAGTLHWGWLHQELVLRFYESLKLQRTYRTIGQRDQEPTQLSSHNPTLQEPVRRTASMNDRKVLNPQCWWRLEKNFGWSGSTWSQQCNLGILMLPQLVSSSAAQTKWWSTANTAEVTANLKLTNKACLPKGLSRILQNLPDSHTRMKFRSWWNWRRNRYGNELAPSRSFEDSPQGRSCILRITEGHGWLEGSAK